MLATFYLILGRFAIDVFGIGGRDKIVDFFIYLGLYVFSVAAYTVVAFRKSMTYLCKK
jgi:hypothetical protein